MDDRGLFCGVDLFLGLVGHLDGLAMATQVIQDRATLESWSLLTAYQRNRELFIAIAKAVYSALISYSNRRPNTADELVPHVQAAIQANTVFQAICATKRHASPDLFPTFAKVLARYVLHQEWGLIANP
jgi:hypothetical protein